MIPEQEMYVILAALMGGLTLLFAVISTFLPSENRKYYVPIIVVPAISALSFALMSQGILFFEEGFETTFPAARMFGYMLIFSIIGGYVGIAGSLGQRQVGILAFCMFLVIVGITLSWAPSPFDSLGALLMFGTLIVVAYLLLKPYDRMTWDLPGEQRLLFQKLRNILLLIWVFYITGTLLTRSNLGYFDAFTSVFVATYMDMVLMFTFGMIVFRSLKAVNQIADSDPLNTGEEPPEQPDASQPEPAD